MDIKFISTTERENDANEIDKMISAVENKNQNDVIEIFDENGEAQLYTYDNFLEIIDEYGLEGFAFQ